MASSRQVDRLCVLSAIRTRWTMTRTHLHHVWTVLLAMCRHQEPLSALHVLSVMRTAQPHHQQTVRRVRRVSIKMYRLKHRVLTARQATMQLLWDSPLA